MNLSSIHWAIFRGPNHEPLERMRFSEELSFTAKHNMTIAYVDLVDINEKVITTVVPDWDWRGKCFQRLLNGTSVVIRIKKTSNV